MKVIKYVLNANGTVPSYVVDGGYLAVASGGSSPQDLLLVGKAMDFAQEPSFADEAEFTAYLKSVVAEGAVDLEGNPIDRDAMAASLWGMLS
jgi:hypothetical protein